MSLSESYRKCILLLLCLAIGPLIIHAQDFPEKPSPPRLVNDFQNTLSSGQAAALEQKLRAYNDSTSNQIAIVIMKSVGNYDISDYSFRLAEKWGIGQKGKDNGLLILAAMEDRKVFIAPGYGLEDVVPDALAKRIVEDYIVPNFKQGNYYKGFDEATNIIIGLASGKFKATDIGKRKKPSNIFFTLFIILIVIIMSFMGRNRRRYTYSGRGMHRSGPFWIGMGGGSGGGSFGGGGGGFGGFGGGGFGGGGAGGSW